MSFSLPPPEAAFYELLLQCQSSGCLLPTGGSRKGIAAGEVRLIPLGRLSLFLLSQPRHRVLNLAPLDRSL